MSDKVRSMLHHLSQSFRDIYRDSLYVVQLRTQKGRVSNFSLVEYSRYR